VFELRGIFVVYGDLMRHILTKPFFQTLQNQK